MVGLEAEASKVVAQSTRAGESAGRGFTEAFVRGSSGTNSAMSAMEAQVARTTSSLESASARVVKAKDLEADAAGRLRIAEAQLNEARGKFATDSAKFIAAEERLEAAKRRNIAASGEVVAATNNEVAANERLAASQDAAASTSVVASSRMASGLKTAALVGTGAVIFGMGEAVKAAGNFEASQERLVTTAGESADQLKLVSDGVLKLAGEVGYSAGEISKGMYTVESAGYHGAEGLKVMQAAAQGAKAEGADLTTVTDAVTTALHDYHLSADQSAIITSKMVTAVGEGKTTFEAFAGSLHSVQPLAGAVGISIDDLYGSLAAMTASGESADQATQNMADAIRHLNAPTSIMRNEMNLIGVNADDVAAHLGERGLAGTMQLLQTSIAKSMPPGSEQVFLDLANAVKTAKPEVQDLAGKVMDGSLSLGSFRKAIKDMDVESAKQATAFATLAGTTHQLGNESKTGEEVLQSYGAALSKATGDVAGMNVALMLTGENSDKTAENIRNVANTTTEADGSVKGWKETQETFNVKLAQFKDGIGATGIAIGTQLLPVGKEMLGWLTDGAHWLGENKWALDLLLISVGAAVTAFAVFKVGMAIWSTLDLGITGAAIAMGAFTVAEDGAAAGAGVLGTALAATGITEIVLGITALVAGLVALGVGVKYAYDHWGWFHDAVQKSWTVLKGVGSWIASAFMGTVHALSHAWENVVHAFGNVEHAFGNVEHAAGNIGHAFGNVVHAGENVGHAIGNAANFAEKALRVVGAVIATVVLVPFKLAANVITGVVHGIGDVWHWLYDHAIGPVVDEISAGLHRGAEVIHWLNDEVIQPVLHVIGDLWHWLYDTAVSVVVDLITGAVHAWGDVMNWLHDSVIKPVGDAIGAAWHWLYDNVIGPVINSVKADIHAWGEVFSWLHDNVIEPVSAKIGDALGGVKNFFSDAVGWIKQVWNDLAKIVGTPVFWIVDLIYNKGIRPVWNDVAGVFGLGTIDEVPPDAIPHYALGGIHQGPGVVPGYAPGQDTVNAKLSPGEGVAVPELVQAIGPQNFLALNAKYAAGRGSRGVPGGFDTGGIFGDIIGGIGDVVGGIGDAVSSVYHGAVDTVKFTAKLMSDPAGAIRDLFSGVTDQTGNTPGKASPWLDNIKAVPGKVIDSVIDMALGWVGVHRGGKPGNEPWSSSAGAEQWEPLIVQALQLEGFPTSPEYIRAAEAQIMTESGGNPNIIQTVQDVNSGGNEAEGLVQVTPATAAGLGLSELGGNLYDPLTNLRLGLRELKSQHGGDLLGTWGHGHGYSLGGIVPGYANGGIVSGPEAALDAVKQHASTMYSWGGSDLSTGVDCSGLVGDAQQIAQGVSSPTARLGTTNTMLGGGWPHVISGATPSDIFAIGTNADHMAASILGTNIEARTTGEKIRIGADAVSPFDKQFSAQFHVDPSVFSPPYSGTSSTTSSPADKEAKLRAAAQKATDAAKASSDAAAGHDKSAEDDLAKAAHSEELAASSTGAARQKHLDAAQHYRDAADKAKAAGQKSRDEAAKHEQTARDDLAKADQAKNTAATSKSSSSSSSSSSSTSSTPMSIHDLGTNLGGIAADAFTETFLPSFISTDASSYPLLKVAATLAGQLPNAKINGSPIQAPDLDDLSDLLPPTHDTGGPVPPGLSVINNKTGGTEYVVNPQLATVGGGRDSDSGGIHIGEMSFHSHGDGSENARQVIRELNSHRGGLSR